MTHPGRKEFARVKVGTDMSLFVKVTKVGLQCKSSKEKALLLTDRLIVV